MVNATDICRVAISIAIVMTVSSSVPQRAREKVPFETLYADRVALPPSQQSREKYRASYVSRDGVVIGCDDRGDCIRPCGGATCAVVIFRPPNVAQEARNDGQRFIPRQ